MKTLKLQNYFANTPTRSRPAQLGASGLLLLSLGLLSGCELNDINTDTTADTDAGEATASPSTSTTAANSGTTNHESTADYTFSEDEVVDITLSDSAIDLSSNANGKVVVTANTATITQAGTYRVKGSLSDGQLIVNSAGATVKLLLAGASVAAYSSNAPLAVLAADKVVILLQDGTENTLTDDSSYVLESGADEPNATLYSKVNLSIYGLGAGTGTLRVDANHNDGIGSKAGLVINHATVTVTSQVDDGIRGKDYLVLRNATLNISAKGDALSSDNDSDTSAGWIRVEGGSYTLGAGGDGLQAATDVVVLSGDFRITTGGGSAASVAADASAKGLKAGANLSISGGSFKLDAAEDAVHSDGHVVIDGGDFTISAADDGIHAESTLTIHNGTIDITKSVEGIESATIVIDGGEVRIESSDDGVNVADGETASGAKIAANRLEINGGYLYVDASGDGIDVNASMTMQDGTVIVQGPTAQNNSALDYDGTFKLSGGYLIAVGSAGMAMAPSAASTQASLKIGYGSSGTAGMGPRGGFGALATSGSSMAAGTLIHVESSDGEDLLTFAPSKSWQSMVFSSPRLTSGRNGSIFTGGSASGSATDGLYNGSTYADGTLKASFVVSGSTTSVSFE